MSRMFTVPGVYRAVAAAAGLFAAPSIAAAGGVPYPGDLGQAVATVVIFTVLLWILGRYAWKPILKQIRRREDDIAQKISSAEDSRAKAEELIQDYRQQLDDIDAKARQVLAKAKKDAARKTEEILDEARHKAKETMQLAREEIDDASQDAQEQLRVATAGMAAQIAAQVLQKSLTDEDHRRLVDDATRQMAEITRNSG